MITQYYRPQTLEEALKLLSQPNTRPLGGGTVLTQQNNESFCVIDLQALGFAKLRKSGHTLEVGAMVTLQTLLESVHTPTALKAAIELESPLNLRSMGTAAGTLVTCDGRSPFGTVMLALDAKCSLVSDQTAIIALGDLLPLRDKLLYGRLITRIEIPLNIRLTFKTIARTPADSPIICAALAQWPSGRVRLTLGGWGQLPTLAMDGNESIGLDEAARNASAESGDAWASTEYRSEMAALLAKRCLEEQQTGSLAS